MSGMSLELLAEEPLTAGHCTDACKLADVPFGEGCACSGHGCGAVCDGLAETLLRRVDIEGEDGWLFMCDACATDALTYCALYGTVETPDVVACGACGAYLHGEATRQVDGVEACATCYATLTEGC